MHAFPSYINTFALKKTRATEHYTLDHFKAHNCLQGAHTCKQTKPMCMKSTTRDMYTLGELKQEENVALWKQIMYYSQRKNITQEYYVQKRHFFILREFSL